MKHYKTPSIEYYLELLHRCYGDTGIELFTLTLTNQINLKNKQHPNFIFVNIFGLKGSGKTMLKKSIEKLFLPEMKPLLFNESQKKDFCLKSLHFKTELKDFSRNDYHVFSELKNFEHDGIEHIPKNIISLFDDLFENIFLNNPTTLIDVIKKIVKTYIPTKKEYITIIENFSNKINRNTDYKTDNSLKVLYDLVTIKNKIVICFINHIENNILSRDVCKCANINGNIKFYNRNIIYHVVSKKKIDNERKYNFLKETKKFNIEFISPLK